MRINRSLLNWGVFLIALGGIPLAVQQGWVDSSIAGDLWRLWPLILVGIGLGLILRWTPLAWFGGALVAGTFGLIFGALIAGGFSGISSACVGSGTGDTVTTEDSDLASGTAFRVDLELTCGELEVERASGSTWEVVAVHDPEEPPAIEGTTAELRVTQHSTDDFFVLGQQTRNDWRVELPATAAITMSTTLNGAEARIDLGDGPVAAFDATFNASDAELDLGTATAPQPLRLDLTLNASSGKVALPAASVVGNVTLNASSLELCIPESVEARVEVEATLAADDLGQSGLVKNGDRWETAGYATAATRVDLSITSTVSSLSVERSEVCP
jgi:hypothetical protein